MLCRSTSDSELFGRCQVELMNSSPLKSRQDLENQLVQVTLATSEAILACAILNRTIRLFHLLRTIPTAAVMAAILSLAIWILCWLTNRIGGQPVSTEEVLFLAVPALLAGVSIFTVYTMHEITLPGNREKIAKLPAGEDGICAMQLWFERAFRLRRQLLFSVMTGVLATVSAALVASTTLNRIISPGMYVAVFLSMAAVGHGAYCALIIPTLARSASKHSMDLYPYDPASSSGIHMASQVFSRLALANSLVVTVMMLLIFVLSPWQEQVGLVTALAWLLIGWGVATYSFAYPHFYLSKAISEAKQRQLHKLDDVIHTYDQRLSSLRAHEFERFQGLLDLRQKISDTRNSAIDFAAWRNYASSLFIPFLSFVAGFAAALNNP